MGRQLSHSAVGKFMQCGKAYDFHYNKKIRSTTTSGALLFGSALDAAINVLFEGLGIEKARAKLGSMWKSARVGSTTQLLPFNEKIVYAAADFDEELLNQDDKALFEYNAEHRQLNKNITEFVKETIEKKAANGWDNLKSDERQLYNYANWLSMGRKGQLMLQAYNDTIMPRIKKVLTYQRKISLNNEEGDSVTGYIDLVCEWEDGSIIVFDNKTSAREYDKDAVLTSGQLALYVYSVFEEFKTRKAGFIVMRKNISKNREKMCTQCSYQAEKGARAKSCTNLLEGKRCGGEWLETVSPEATIQVLIDEMPQRTEDLVLENFADITHLIKQEVYPRNLQSCNNVFGQPCTYKKLCYEGKMEGLEETE